MGGGREAKLKTAAAAETEMQNNCSSCSSAVSIFFPPAVGCLLRRQPEFPLQLPFSH